MIHTIEGTVSKKGDGYVVIDNNKIGFKLTMGIGSVQKLPSEGSNVKCFCSLFVKDDQIELFGFLDEPSLRFFELLRTVNGVGPKTAFAILDLDSIERLTAAIIEKKSDIIARASGVGKKTAERVVLELHTKLKLNESSKIVGHMDTGIEVEEALVGLGYSRHEARSSVREINTTGSFSDQLKAALKYLGEKKK